MSGKQSLAPRPEKPVAAANMLAIIAQAAADPSVDVAKMTALLELQERLIAREAQADFNHALAQMNRGAEMRVTKEGEVRLSAGGKVSYRFAKWEDMDAVIRPLLQEHGFTLSFDTELRPNGIIVIGTLLHEGGHSRKASIPLVIDSGPGRNANQAMGSTVSYGKRYTTEMLLNIVRVDEDDDGLAGGGGRPIIHDVDDRPTRRDGTNAEVPADRARGPGSTVDQMRADIQRDPIDATIGAGKAKPGRQTIGAFLDELEKKLNDADSAEEIDAICASPQVMKVTTALKPEPLSRLRRMIASALARVGAVDEIEQEVAASEEKFATQEPKTVTIPDEPETVTLDPDGIYALDEEGETVLDEAGEVWRFNDYKEFAAWYVEYIRTSPNPDAVRKNNSATLNEAMGDGPAQAILEPPPEQPKSRARPPAGKDSPLFVPIPDTMANGSPNWAKYTLAVTRKLAQCWSADMLDELERVNAPTYASVPAVTRRITAMIKDRSIALSNANDREMQDALDFVNAIVGSPSVDAMRKISDTPAAKTFRTAMQQTRHDDIHLMIQAAGETTIARLNSPPPRPGEGR